jgi:hypothetical protein
MAKPLTNKKARQLTGTFYILVRDYLPDMGNRYFIAGDEFEVTSPGTFKHELLLALNDRKEEILANLENMEEFDPDFDIIIIPASSWLTLEDLDIKEDINNILFDDENEEGESDEDENVDNEEVNEQSD